MIVVMVLALMVRDVVSTGCPTGTTRCASRTCCPSWTKCPTSAANTKCICKLPFDTVQLYAPYDCPCKSGATKVPAGQTDKNTKCTTVPGGCTTVTSVLTSAASSTVNNGCAAAAICATGYSLTAGTGKCDTTNEFLKTLTSDNCYLTVEDTITNQVTCELKDAASITFFSESSAQAFSDFVAGYCQSSQLTASATCSTTSTSTICSGRKLLAN